MATFTNQTKTGVVVFTNVDKSRLTPTSERYLDIGSGFNLLIGGGYRLVIQPEIAAISWSAQVKN